MAHDHRRADLAAGPIGTIRVTAITRGCATGGVTAMDLVQEVPYLFGVEMPARELGLGVCGR